MHQCSSLLIRCMDFRLTSAIDNWLEEKGLMNDCDIVSVAGASKFLSGDLQSVDAQFLLSQIKLSKQLHNISTVYLMHHTDCGAYGGRDNFESENQEREKHTEDLRRAAEVLEKEIEDVKIVKVLAEMKDSGKIECVEI